MSKISSRKFRRQLIARGTLWLPNFVSFIFTISHVSLNLQEIFSNFPPNFPHLKKIFSNVRISRWPIPRRALESAFHNEAYKQWSQKCADKSSELLLSRWKPLRGRSRMRDKMHFSWGTRSRHVPRRRTIFLPTPPRVKLFPRVIRDLFRRVGKFRNKTTLNERITRSN